MVRAIFLLGAFAFLAATVPDPARAHFVSAAGLSDAAGAMPVLSVHYQRFNRNTRRTAYRDHHRIHFRRGFRAGYRHGFVGTPVIAHRHRIRRHHRTHFLRGYRRGFRAGEAALLRQVWQEQAAAASAAAIGTDRMAGPVRAVSYYGSRYYRGPRTAPPPGVVRKVQSARLTPTVRRTAPPPRKAVSGDLEPWSTAWVRSCQARYKTFDPKTGFYIPRPGEKRFCR
ncbi:MAG: BA14K family protein [Pseudomonadota bacterium]